MNTNNEKIIAACLSELCDACAAGMPAGKRHDASDWCHGNIWSRYLYGAATYAPTHPGIVVCAASSFREKLIQQNL